MKDTSSPKIDFSKVRTYPLASRKCKVDRGDFGKPVKGPGRSFRKFLDSLPGILSAKELSEFSKKLAAAFRSNKKAYAAIGGHVIKTGVAPHIADLIGRGVISGVFMNGAAAIHDFEIALNGKTSEDVAESLVDGSFGMAYETGLHINDAFAAARKNGTGAGYEIYKKMIEIGAPHRESSLIFNAFEAKALATVHIAVGTDIVHVHPNSDGEAIGAATFNDFKVFCSAIAGLREGSVYMNIGSAVVMPEVFLKALTVCRNLGHPVRGFHTANFDMISQYRPGVNVLSRPTIGSGGRSFGFIGCHEIMIPLLHAMVVEILG